MSRLEDLVTQVANPDEGAGEASGSEGESDNERGRGDSGGTRRRPWESVTGVGASSARRPCSLLCCGAGARGKPAARAKPALALKVPAPAPPAPGEPERDLINSPRNAGAPKATAPYRDDALLPPLSPRIAHKKCLVLDLDETLVHSSFKPVDRCDFVVPVEIEGRVHQVYVAKRPFVDEFMKRMGELYEVVVFTASLAKYADPVLDLLDIHKVVDHRLFRESCSCFKGSYVKDMGRMGRELARIMILDNSPHSYAFNPENAVPCESWFNDYEDTELRELIPIFEQLAEESVDDVMVALEKMKISAPVSLSTDESDSVSYSESDEETGSEERESD